MSEVELVGPWPRQEAARGWDKVSKYVQAANSRSGGRYSAVATFEALASGRMQLWTIEKGPEVLASVITEIVTYPTGLQVCSIVALTGKMREEWVEAWRDIADWAKGQGCRVIESWARMGWSREMKKHGWKETHRLIEFSLE